jgi:hypothetical protein
MSEESRQTSRWQQHRFLIMIVATIAIALFLVSAALALYASSGAAQLDLSRPGYQSVRDQAMPSNSFDGFSASGPLDDEALDQFKKLYDERAAQATSVESFGGDPLSSGSLGIDAPGGQ